MFLNFLVPTTYTFTASELGDNDYEMRLHLSTNYDGYFEGTTYSAQTNFLPTIKTVANADISVNLGKNPAGKFTLLLKRTSFVGVLFLHVILWKRIFCSKNGKK